jgi:hypothetical protein
MPAAFRFVAAVVADILKGVQLGIHDHDHGTTIAAVTTTGSALGDELLSSKGHTAIATAAGENCNAGEIDELHAYSSRTLTQLSN